MNPLAQTVPAGSWLMYASIRNAGWKFCGFLVLHADRTRFIRRQKPGLLGRKGILQIPW